MQGRDEVIVAEERSGVVGRNERLRELEEELRRWKSMFDASRMLIGHEISRPLTAMEGYLDLLEIELEEYPTGKWKAYIDKIRAAMGKLKDISDSFVQMLMIDRESNARVGREKVEIRELVEDVVGRIGNEGLQVKVEIGDDVPPINVCRRYLEVVLENIVSNAVAHSRSSAPLEIRALVQRERRGGSEGWILILEVEDRGEGIPTENVEDVFNPFYKLDDDGMGLGLTLVRNLLYVMGGDISIKSGKGMGTKVTIVLPYTEQLMERV